MPWHPVSHPQKEKKYVGSTPQQVAENVLNRNFEAEAPNQKWVTDVTEFNVVENNPLGFTDPTGNMKWSQIDDF